MSAGIWPSDILLQPGGTLLQPGDTWLQPGGTLLQPESTLLQPESTGGALQPGDTLLQLGGTLLQWRNLWEAKFGEDMMGYRIKHLVLWDQVRQERELNSCIWQMSH